MNKWVKDTVWWINCWSYNITYVQLNWKLITCPFSRKMEVCQIKRKLLMSQTQEISILNKTWIRSFLLWWLIVAKAKKKSGFWSPSASPQTHVSAFNFVFAMKQCPIAAIDLPHCALSDFFTGVWMFARFVRPLLTTILCIWEIWSTRIQYIPVFKKKDGRKKAHHHTDFEADRWPETGDFLWPI